MIRPLVFALLALACGATSAGAVVVEVPLPGLLGAYGPPPATYVRTVAFSLPQSPLVVHAVSIRMRGSGRTGRLLCDSHPVPAERDWNSRLFLEMVESGPGGWVTDYCPAVPSGGAFGCTLAFTGVSFPPSPPPTWAFLADGQGELSIILDDMNYFGCTELTEFPITVLDEATLIVDADFAVPALTRTWGRIKTTYR